LPSPPQAPAWAALVAAYENTAEHNDRLHRELTAATWADPLLAGHRRHIEEHQLGFGDAAFHALWRRLLEAAAARFGRVRALEIGVFKGQVISLWSLLAREHSLNLEVSAVSPLAGQPLTGSRLLRSLRYRLDRRFRERVDSGDFYPAEDYARIIGGLFAHFGLEFDRVRLHRGYSTDPLLLAGLKDDVFEVIYVDGDHTLQGARHDFRTFGPKVVPGGWLVADDAGCDLPGSGFWKGHPTVSEAVRELPALGFRNVLNVGHNRVYEKVA
jgi:predicted O-methyltransferase YrrM